MSSFTKPCNGNVLSMFLNLQPWKPYILISFALMYPVQVVSSISGNIITIILGWITSFVNNKKIKSYISDNEKSNIEYNIMIPYQTYYD